MNYQLFSVLHVTSVILLSGVTFAAFAAPQSENRRSCLMMSGVLSLLVFLTGFGVMGMMGLGFPGWAIVKVVCWLALSGLTGMAFRMTGQIRMPAIAIGIICEAYISYMKELLNYQDLKLISKQIVRYFGLVKIDDQAIKGVCSLVKQDKKNEDKIIMCTLLKGIGTVLYDQKINKIDVRESLIYYRNLKKE